jgi:hypothetical protein
MLASFLAHRLNCIELSAMNTTAHLLSTKANKKRLVESIAQDKKTSKEAGYHAKKKPNKVSKKFL